MRGAEVLLLPRGAAELASLRGRDEEKLRRGGRLLKEVDRAGRLSELCIMNVCLVGSRIPGVQEE